MKANIRLIALICIVVAVASLGCGRPGVGSKDLHVAIVSALTGPYAEPGIDMANGAEMAISDANARGGVGGFKLVADKFDDAGNPGGAPSVAARIAGDNRIVGVVGHLNSGTTLAALEVYANAGLPLIMPVPTNPKITERGFSNLFRIPITDNIQGQSLAKFARESLKADNLAIIHDSDAWGEGIASVVRDDAQRLGPKVVFFDSVSPQQKDFLPIILKLKRLSPKAIFFAGGAVESGLFFKQAAENQLKSSYLMGDSCFSPELISIAGAQNLEGRAYVSYIAPPWTENPRAKAFVDAYTKKYGAIKGFAPLGYDATQVLIESLRNVDQSKPIGEIRKAIIQNLHAPSFSLEGMIGSIHFNPNGDNTVENTYFYQVVSGQFVVVKPKAKAAAAAF